MASPKILYYSTPKFNNSPSSICTILLILNSWIKNSKSYQESKLPCLIQTVFLWLSGVLGRLFSVALIPMTMIFQRAKRIFLPSASHFPSCSHFIPSAVLRSSHCESLHWSFATLITNRNSATGVSLVYLLLNFSQNSAFLCQCRWNLTEILYF